MSETTHRPVVCSECGGDGDWDDVVGRDPDGPVWRSFKCDACDGSGEVAIKFEPVEMEDFDNIAEPPTRIAPYPHPESVECLLGYTIEVSHHQDCGRHLFMIETSGDGDLITAHMTLDQAEQHVAQVRAAIAAVRQTTAGRPQT